MCLSTHLVAVCVGKACSVLFKRAVCWYSQDNLQFLQLQEPQEIQGGWNQYVHQSSYIQITKQNKNILHRQTHKGFI